MIAREKFRSFDSGAMRGGIRWAIRTDLGLETHECYQYGSPEEIDAAVEAMKAIAGMEKIDVVTYSEGYKNMKVLSRWENPECGLKVRFYFFEDGGIRFSLSDGREFFEKTPDEITGYTHLRRVRMNPSAYIAKNDIKPVASSGVVGSCGMCGAPARAGLLCYGCAKERAEMADIRNNHGGPEL